MVYTWSHSQEAYENVRANIEDLPYETLRIVWAEIKTYETRLRVENIKRRRNNKEVIKNPVSRDSFYNEETYNNWYNKFVELNLELEKAKIIEYTFELKECDNGGFNAYICPYGCHKVPFSRIDEIIKLTEEFGLYN